MGFKILYVEDDVEQRELVVDLIKKNGYDVMESSNAIEGINKIKNNQIDLVISDFRMPEVNGDEFLLEVKNINPEISFIMVTAYGDIDLAVNSIKGGAVDFLTKPFNFDDLLIKIKGIAKDKLEKYEIEKINYKIDDSIVLNDIPLGNSEAFKDIISKIPRISVTNTPILITGESGTGKEVIADLIYANSTRKDKAFIKVNCGAIPENLIESELFGYEKGAFTGATSSKTGYIESADNGTLFLDEIGELPFTLQSKLLRFLQNSEIQKLGSSKNKKVDVRIISATNQNLKQQIKEKNFREDLYFRLNIINLRLPSLRERKEDIPVLIDYFVNKYSKLNNLPEKVFSKEAKDKLMKYSYPGNIRELENIIQNALVLSISNIIEAEDIPIITDESNTGDIDYDSIPDKVDDMNAYIENIEKHLISKALERNNNNQSKTAKELNITLRVLRYKMDKYDL